MVFSCSKHLPNKAIKRHKLQIQNQYKTNHVELQGLLDPLDHEYLHGPLISVTWTFKFLMMFLRVLKRLIFFIKVFLGILPHSGKCTGYNIPVHLDI